MKMIMNSAIQRFGNLGILFAGLFLAVTLQGQTLITPSNPYLQDWDSTTLENDGWTAIPDFSGSSNTNIVETLVSRGDGHALRLNHDFTQATVASLHSSFRTEAVSDLSDVLLEFDLFMSEAGFAQVTFDVQNLATSDPEELRWNFSNDPANVWQTHSFRLDSSEDTFRPSGYVPFDPSNDFRIRIIMDGTFWGEDDGNSIRLDNFSISVPEPSDYIFASGICLIAFAMFRRIRIAKSSI